MHEKHYYEAYREKVTVNCNNFLKVETRHALSLRIIKTYKV
jgi:hypothetical protein